VPSAAASFVHAAVLGQTPVAVDLASVQVHAGSVNAKRMMHGSQASVEESQGEIARYSRTMHSKRQRAPFSSHGTGLHVHCFSHASTFATPWLLNGIVDFAAKRSASPDLHATGDAPRSSRRIAVHMTRA
jgi:hypothetical protein